MIYLYSLFFPLQWSQRQIAERCKDAFKRVAIMPLVSYKAFVLLVLLMAAAASASLHSPDQISAQLAARVISVVISRVISVIPDTSCHHPGTGRRMAQDRQHIQAGKCNLDSAFLLQ